MLAILFCNVAPHPIVGGSFGFGAGSITLSGLQCTGEEPNLPTCPARGHPFTVFCTHLDDAGVICPRMSLDKILAVVYMYW